ncbi:FtsX-like permease family protein [Saprospiraceae bacterium]|nr:FtsX-like permease family protein [Saprospiraceae bacterium]
MNLAYLSWRNIWHKPLSTLLSIVLIAFGVGLLSMIFLFQDQFQEQFDKNQAGVDLVVGAKGSPLQLILSSMFHVDSPTGNIKIGDAKFVFNPKHPLIDVAVPLSVGDSYRGFRIIGTDHRILELYPAELHQGKLWSNGMEVSVGYQVAKQLNLQIGDEFYSSHGFNHGDLEHDEGEAFVVKGIFAAHGSVIDRLILCNTKAIWEVHEHHDHEHHHEVNDSSEQKAFSLLDYPEKSITSALVRFKPDKRKTIPAINMPRGINENTPIMATSPPYELNKLIAQVGSGLKTIQYLAMIIALISGLSIFISMFNKLKDRKYELGVMRIGGGSPGQLFRMMLIEALIIGLIGGLIGLFLAHTGIWLISQLLEQNYNYGLSSTSFIREELWVLFLTLLISFLAAIIPAWKAYRTDIIEQI